MSKRAKKPGRAGAHPAPSKGTRPPHSARIPRLPNIAISIRLPISMLDELKLLANQRDVPYQSLMKLYLSECLRRERRG